MEKSVVALCRVVDPAPRVGVGKVTFLADRRSSWIYRKYYTGIRDVYSKRSKASLASCSGFAFPTDDSERALQFLTLGVTRD